MKVCYYLDEINYTRENIRYSMGEPKDLEDWNEGWVNRYRNDGPGKTYGDLIYSDELTFWK